MEKNSYTIDFNLKNNPSAALREINGLLAEIEKSSRTMAEGMTQQMAAMQGPVDEARQKWLEMSGSAGAYFAVLSENASAISLLMTLAEKLSALKSATDIGAKAQDVYNSAINIGTKALKSYKDHIVTAQAAISTTTGATKALNIAIAASPYILAAAAVAALAVGVYKLYTSSAEATGAQKRLNDTMLGMHTEIAKEQTALDALFEPLNRAKAGTEEWQKAKDAIVAKYGGYLEKVGVEINSINTARAAYTKLSQAILDTARARAMEKATTGAGEAYAATEGNALKNIRRQLYSGIGQGAGKITAGQAGKAWAQIRAAVRSGEDIPQEARKILEQTDTVYTDQFGVHTMSPIAGYIYRQVEEVRKASAAYKEELADAQAMFGGTGAPLHSAAQTPPRPQHASGRNYTRQSAKAAGTANRPEQPRNEALRMPRPTKPGGAVTSPIRDAMRPSAGKGGALDGFSIPEMNFEKPLAGMEAWNQALQAAHEKHAMTIDSLSAMGSAMGSLGGMIGGQAGAWLDWGGNMLNAIAQALPQLAALCTANTASAATGAASSVASIPLVGPIMAVAAVASVLAALAGLPKFANGGLAYGPTLGLFGEYAGASNNPEVVAPLSRLRQLIQPAGYGSMAGDVRFRIDGRVLTGILERETNLTRRS